MAISTYPVTLKAGGSKLCDVKDFPDLGGAPELLETTTLSDSSRTYIQGIKDQQALEFTANYDAAAYEAVNALTTTTTFTLEFGTDGAGGIFTWSGTASAYILGAGVNEVVEMRIVIIPSTPITKSS
jgi:hypothetical protein